MIATMTTSNIPFWFPLFCLFFLLFLVQTPMCGGYQDLQMFDWAQRRLPQTLSQLSVAHKIMCMIGESLEVRPVADFSIQRRRLTSYLQNGEYLFLERRFLYWNENRWILTIGVSWDSHYIDVIMSVLAFQITGVSIVCLIVCSGAD